MDKKHRKIILSEYLMWRNAISRGVPIPTLSPNGKIREVVPFFDAKVIGIEQSIIDLSRKNTVQILEAAEIFKTDDNALFKQIKSFPFPKAPFPITFAAYGGLVLPQDLGNKHMQTIGFKKKTESAEVFIIGHLIDENKKRVWEVILIVESFILEQDERYTLKHIKELRDCMHLMYIDLYSNNQWQQPTLHTTINLHSMMEIIMLQSPAPERVTGLGFKKEIDNLCKIHFLNRKITPPGFYLIPSEEENSLQEMSDEESVHAMTGLVSGFFGGKK